MDRGLAAPLRTLLEKGEPAAHIVITRARGSTPREEGAAMLVTETAAYGTIGGGRVEWDAVERAHRLLLRDETEAMLDMALSPAIGQCCGGRVNIAITRADAALLARIEADERIAEAARPAVLLFGAGHVGRALASALAPLPLAVRWIDGRPQEFGPAVPHGITQRVTTDWEGEIARAPAGAACLVLTHSHALDSLITAAALLRDDFAYVGLIGSSMKRRRFERGFRDIGLSEARIGRLVCPIGGNFVRDKRPEVIAAFAAAEVLHASLSWQQANSLGRERAA